MRADFSHSGTGMGAVRNGDKAGKTKRRADYWGAGLQGLANLKKKKGWPDRSSRGLSPVGSTTEMGVDIGYAHLCTLQ